jgi:tetratricopeptide (TPR) repeat protein
MLLIDNSTKAIAVLLAVLTLISVGCSGRDTQPRGSEELDRAIALYIAGEYERAVEALVELTGKLESEGDLQTTYLYLGRSYLSLGDYVRAADAFSSGILLGGGIEFDQYLETAQQHLRSTPRIIGTQEFMTRGQLAALIDNLFGRLLEYQTVPGGNAVDMETHWARAYASRMYAARVMLPLADGSFRADAAVTYPAFYVTVLRLARAAGIPGEAVAAHFPNGLRGVVESSGSSIDGDARMTGSEATRILESLLEASE